MSVVIEVLYFCRFLFTYKCFCHCSFWLFSDTSNCTKIAVEFYLVKSFELFSSLDIKPALFYIWKAMSAEYIFCETCEQIKWNILLLSDDNLQDVLFIRCSCIFAHEFIYLFYDLCFFEKREKSFSILCSDFITRLKMYIFYLKFKRCFIKKKVLCRFIKAFLMQIYILYDFVILFGLWSKVFCSV